MAYVAQTSGLHMHVYIHVHFVWVYTQTQQKEMLGVIHFSDESDYIFVIFDY